MESFVTRSYTCRPVTGPAKTTVMEALRKGGLAKAVRISLDYREAVPVPFQFRLDESRAKYISPDSKYAYDQFNILAEFQQQEIGRCINKRRQEINVR